MRCDLDIRNTLFQNVVLSGGNTLFPGFAERIRRDLTALAWDGCNINVIARPGRMHSAWIGGSVFAYLSSIKDTWVTKQEYDRTGPTVVHSKCFP